MTNLQEPTIKMACWWQITKKPEQDPKVSRNFTTREKSQGFLVTGLFSSQKILQNFSHFPSYRIFRRIHGVLNINENKN
jgi:tRNA(Met) C34 N-acetyltransferase TmcA